MSELDHVRLLLAIVERRWDRAKRYAASARSDPGGFVEIGRQTDLLPWIHSLLTSSSRESLVGPEAMARLGDWRKKIRNDNLLLLARAEEALDRLLDAGVVPLALKGLDLMHRIYDRFDERTMTDVDLLVRTEELPAALDALRAAGWELPAEPGRTHYIRSSHHIPLKSPGPVIVEFEIHWNLAQQMRFRIDPAELFDRAVEAEIAGRNVLRLDDRDLVAHLLLHHFTHYFERQLKWAVDMHAISAQPGFDWNGVVARLRGWDATAVSGYALLHLKKVFPDWIPDTVMEQLDVPAWRRMLTAPLLSGHPLELFRNTRSRQVQLYLAAVMLERPLLLPRWLMHRTVRDRRSGENPLEALRADPGAPSRTTESAPTRRDRRGHG